MLDDPKRVGGRARQPIGLGHDQHVAIPGPPRRARHADDALILRRSPAGAAN
jgi:hypothetical protein